MGGWLLPTWGINQRSKSTHVRGSPAYIRNSVLDTQREPNRLACFFERKTDQEVRANDPMIPFVVIAVGWMIKRFQPREHVISSHNMLLFGREFVGGDRGSSGKQFWHRIAARVGAGRGKVRGQICNRCVGSVRAKIANTHLVVDIERRLQELRTVRRTQKKKVRMECRNASGHPGVTRQSHGTDVRQTIAVNAQTGRGAHSAECRQRFGSSVSSGLDLRHR